MKKEFEKKEAAAVDDDLIARVLQMPEEVTRPCLIPLSKVGFTEGRLIHTNEFYITDEDGTERVLSHTQVAEYLRQKQSTKYEGFYDEDRSIVINNKEETLLHTTDTPRMNESRRLDTQTDHNEAIKYGSISANSIDLDEEEAEDNLPVFDISEVIDPQDKIISQEIYNVHDQMASLEKTIASHQQQQSSSQKKTGVEDGDDDGKLDTMLDILRGSLSSKQMKQAATPTDDDSSFVRRIEKLSRLSRHHKLKQSKGQSLDIDLTFLDGLAKKEQELERSNSTVEIKPIAVVKKEVKAEVKIEVFKSKTAQPHAGGSAGGGWKKGFLGSNNTKAASTRPTSGTAIRDTTPTTAPAVVVSEIESPAEVNTPVGIPPTSTDQINPITMSKPTTTTTTAYTDKVVERSSASLLPIKPIGGPKKVLSFSKKSNHQ